MPIGLYIHIPFCRSKCAYCDFYSFAPAESVLDEYRDRVIEDLKKWAARLNRAADTLYFGGGTPSVMGGERLAEIVETARQYFGLENAEITVECNPGDPLEDDFRLMARAGINRISIGAQSGVDEELVCLSRRHTADQIGRTVRAALAAGIDNISLDVMLGIPKQTSESLSATLQSFTSLPIRHISAYMLKVEKGTPMEKMVDMLPDDDTVAQLYLQTCSELSVAGFERYEISNFCRKGYPGRHNLKYWQCREYLGIGPSAHSFIDGQRFFYPRDFAGYMAGADPTDDGLGGDPKEKLMLALRISDGVDFVDFCRSHCPGAEADFLAEGDRMVKMGLMTKNGSRYTLTDEGALVSNSCILRFTDLF